MPAVLSSAFRRGLPAQAKDFVALVNQFGAKRQADVTAAHNQYAHGKRIDPKLTERKALAESGLAESGLVAGS